MYSAFGVDHGDIEKALRRAPGLPNVSLKAQPVPKRRRLTNTDKVGLKVGALANKMDPTGNPTTALLGRRLAGG